MKKTANKKQALPVQAVPAPKPDAGAHGRRARPLLLWGAVACFFVAFFYGPSQEAVASAQRALEEGQLVLRDAQHQVEQFQRMTKAGKFQRFDGMDDKSLRAHWRTVAAQAKALKSSKENSGQLARLEQERSLLEIVMQARSILDKPKLHFQELEKSLQARQGELEWRRYFRNLYLAGLGLLCLIILYAAAKQVRAGTSLFSLAEALPVQVAMFVTVLFLVLYSAWAKKEQALPADIWDLGKLLACWLILGSFRAPMAYRLREKAHAASGFEKLGLTLRNWLGSLDFGLTLLALRILRWSWRSLGVVFGLGLDGSWRPFLLGSAVWGALEISLVAWGEHKGTMLGMLGMGLWLLAIFAAVVGHILWARAQPRSAPEARPSFFARLALALATVLSYLVGVWLSGALWNGVGSLVLASTERHFEAAHFQLIPTPAAQEIPEAENAAPLLDQAQGAYRALSLSAGGSKKLDEDRDRITKIFTASVSSGQLTQTAALTATLVRFQPLLAMERKALQRPHAVWPMPVKEYNWYRPIPEFYGHLVVARMMSAEGLLALSQGRQAAALAQVAELRTLAARLGEHPSLIAQMMSVAVEGHALDLETLLLKHGWQAPPANSKRPMTAKVMTAVRWEMALQEEDLRHLSRAWIDGSVFKMQEKLEFKLAIPVLKFWIAERLRVSGRALDEIQKEPLLDKDRFDAWLEAAGENKGYFNNHLGYFTGGLRNCYSRGLEKDQKALLISAASQCQAFKKKTGRWPLALWEAVPLAAERKDYFSAGSMKILLRDGGGVMVYSVWQDGVDDLGAPVVVGGNGDMSVTVM